MNKERVAVLGIALGFYALGGWSLYDGFQHDVAHRHGAWQSTDAIITAQYAQDIRDHDLVPHQLLGYKYMADGISYEVKNTAAQAELAGFLPHGKNIRVNYKLEDPAVAALGDDPGHPQYAVGLGLIGFGTLLALVREIVMKRRGKFRGDALPVFLKR